MLYRSKYAIYVVLEFKTPVTSGFVVEVSVMSPWKLFILIILSGSKTQKLFNVMMKTEGLPVSEAFFKIKLNLYFDPENAVFVSKNMYFFCVT